MDLNNKNKISYLSRFFARSIDYLLTYSLIASGAALVTTISSPLVVAFALGTPIVWAIIEIILIQRLGTTPGKALFGISVREESKRKLSFKQACKYSLFLLCNRSQYIQKNSSGKAKKVFAFFLFSCFLLSSFFVSIGQYLPIEDLISWKKADWVTYAPSSQRFTAAFPADPVLESRKLDIPNTRYSLNYQELYTEAKDILYSVSYVDFPKRFKWLGTKKLLQKSLEILLSTEAEPYELIHQQFTQYHNQPAIDFIVKKNEKEMSGRLILSGTTLYRLMISYPHALTEKMSDNHFLDSFQLTPHRRMS